VKLGVGDDLCDLCDLCEDARGRVKFISGTVKEPVLVEVSPEEYDAEPRSEKDDERALENEDDRSSVEETGKKAVIISSIESASTCIIAAGMNSASPVEDSA